MAIRPRLIAWAEPQHEPIIRSLLAENACELIGVCAQRADDAAALAQRLECERLDDLRQAMLSPDAEVILLAAPALLDGSLRRAMREHGVLALSCEPMPDGLAEPSNEGFDAPAASFVPAFVDGRGCSSALDSIEQFGPCRAASLCFLSSSAQGSLFARLFDAMMTVRLLLGHAELIDASMTLPRASVPDQLTGLQGTMTLNLRLEQQRTASVLISNEAPGWQREAIIVCDSKQVLRIIDDRADWLGEPVEARQVEAGQRHGAQATASELGSLIADQLVRLMNMPRDGRGAGDSAALLAMCEAARLSARVGFAEAPGAISRMLSRP